MTIPTLNALWRPNGGSVIDDRELIREYALWPLSEYNLTQLTATMNRIAQVSPAAVTSVQGWIDEIETLEQNWADQVEDGTAHLGNVESYEGPTPGTTLTRQDRQTKADVLEWDSSLLKVKYQAGRRSDSTAGGVLHARVDKLKAKVFQTLGIKPYDGGSGSGSRLVRS
jgi:HAMP domain-containing protein